MPTIGPGLRLVTRELCGPVVTVHVYPDARYAETLDLCDRTSPYALTGGVFAPIGPRSARPPALLDTAGNFYVNDKPTGAVVGQQPFGGARASGTNDKAGSPLNLMRWVSARTVRRRSSRRATSPTRTCARSRERPGAAALAVRALVLEHPPRPRPGRCASATGSRPSPGRASSCSGSPPAASAGRTCSSSEGDLAARRLPDRAGPPGRRGGSRRSATASTAGAPATAPASPGWPAPAAAATSAAPAARTSAAGATFTGWDSRRRLRRARCRRARLRAASARGASTTSRPRRCSAAA